jgi:hypothetical protein
MSAMHALAIFTLMVLLAGCGGDPAGPTLSADPEPASALPDTGPLSALEMIPESATAATLTDFDAIRVRFGVPEMTSADLMTDRNEFWEQVDEQAVLLTDGLFRADNSTWELDYGFTEDDVDWEVHFAGPEGSGYAVSFRPDLDLAGVRQALGTRQLAGASLVGSVLEKGTTFGASWADDPAWGHLVLPDVESSYLRKGCVPLLDALGDAAVDDPRTAQVREAAPDLQALDAWSVSFADGIVTALVGLGRGDVIARTDLGTDWPATGPITFDDGFTQPLDDPVAGRIGYQVVDPQAAASLTLGEELPFAVCNDTIPVVEPSGL